MSQNQEIDITKLNQVVNLFSIPDSTWAAVNKRAYLVGVKDLADQYYYQFGGYSELDKLVSVNYDWRAYTFPSIVSVVQKMKSFASIMAAVKEKYQKAAPDADSFFTQTVLPGLAAIVSTINEILGKISTFANTNLDADKTVTHMKVDLSYYNMEYTGEEYKAVDNAIVTIAVGWAYLDEITVDIQKQLQHTDPHSQFMKKIEIITGSNLWDNVISGADAFLSRQSLLNKYLDGSFLYENSPVQPQTWYLLGCSAWNGDQYLQGVNGQPALNVQGFMSQFDPDDNCKWQFKLTRAGYYYLVNKSTGDSLVVEVIHRDGGYTSRMSPPGDSPGQYWRFYDDRITSLLLMQENPDAFLTVTKDGLTIGNESIDFNDQTYQEFYVSALP